MPPGLKTRASHWFNREIDQAWRPEPEGFSLGLLRRFDPEFHHAVNQAARAQGLTPEQVLERARQRVRAKQAARLPEAILALRRLAANRRLSLATALPEGRSFRERLLGLGDVPHRPESAGAGVFQQDLPDHVILHHNAGGSTVRGGVNINGSDLTRALDDKWHFAQIMEHGTGGGPGLPDSIPKTELFETALARHGGDLEKLKAEFGDFVVKPRSGARTRRDALINSDNLKDPRLSRAAQEPRGHVIQPKLDIVDEYRVHLLNNHPFTAARRYLTNTGPLARSTHEVARALNEGAIVPLVGPARKEVQEFARQATAHIGRSPEGGQYLGTRDENVHHALDIARLRDGSLRVIESNPTPGTLMNPIVSRKLHHLATGRLDHGTLAMAGLAGVAGAGLALRWLARKRRAARALGQARAALAGTVQLASAKHAALKPSAKLKDYQQEAVDRVADNDGSLLIAHPMGSGKTMTSVAAVERLRELGKAKRTLAIVPAALRDNMIDRGVHRFSDQKAIRLGSKGEAGSYHVGQPLPDANYYITSIEQFRQDPNAYLKTTRADTIVVDELHKARDDSTRNYDALLAARPHVRNFIGLTGTPVMNHPRDIVPVLDLVTNRKHRLGNVRQFDQVFTREEVKHHGPFGWLGHGPTSKEKHLINTDYLQEELRKHIHYVEQEDVGQLPKKTIVDVEVPMSHYQEKLHRAAMDRSGLSPIDRWRIEHNLPVNQRLASFYLARLQQARQASNAIHPFDKDYTPLRSAEETPKVKKLLDDVEAHIRENPKHQATISTMFVRGGADQLSAGLSRRGIAHGWFLGSGYQKRADRDLHVKDYLAGKRRVMIVNQAGAEGLNLNNTTFHATLDPHYNPATIAQMEGRGLRADNPAPEIPVHRYKSVLPRARIAGIPISPKLHGTDEWIYGMMDRKEKLNDELLGLLRDRPKQKAAMDKEALNALMKRLAYTV